MKAKKAKQAKAKPAQKPAKAAAEKKGFPKWLHYGLFLLVLGMIVGAGLMAVNALTSPVIAKNKMKQFAPLLKEVSAEAEFTDVTSANPNLPNEVQYIFLGKAGGAATHYVFWLKTNGYGGGAVDTLVAFAVDGTVTNVKVIATVNQTAGIGDKIEDEAEIAKWGLTGKTAAELAQTAIGELEVISGATISSNAVNSAAICAAKVVGGGINE